MHFLQWISYSFGRYSNYLGDVAVHSSEMLSRGAFIQRLTSKVSKRNNAALTFKLMPSAQSLAHKHATQQLSMALGHSVRRLPGPEE